MSWPPTATTGQRSALLLLPWWLIVMVMLLGHSARAHEIRPAYLHVTQLTDQQFAIAWKEPVRAGRHLGLQTVLPTGCPPTTEPTMVVRPDSLSRSWTVRCPNGLVGEIRIEGLSRTLIDAFVRIDWLSGESETAVLKPTAPTFTIGSQGTAIFDYLRLGIEHMVFGIDHVLFVLGLMYVVSGPVALIRTITAFTVAHSVTLGLSALNIVTVPAGPVEAVIALSIVFLAAEALRPGRTSLAYRMPWVVAFGFGLLHGFGFAGALADLGLPPGGAAAALFLFNLGVEIGQLAVIAALLALVWLWRRVGLTTATPRLTTVALVAPAIAMGSVASFWTMERIVNMLA